MVPPVADQITFPFDVPVTAAVNVWVEPACSSVNAAPSNHICNHQIVALLYFLSDLSVQLSQPPVPVYWAVVQLAPNFSLGAPFSKSRTASRRRIRK